MGRIFSFLGTACLALSLALGLSLSSAAALKAADTVKIGIMAPTTGPWASEGQDMVRVIEILTEQINEQGGLNGLKVELEIGDDGGSPKTAALAAQRLITSQVSAVVGTYGSAVTEASQDIFDEAGIVQIATGSTSIRLTEKNLPRFFRTCPRDDEQGRVLANNIKELGFSKPAVIHDNTSYAKGLADETRAIFPSLGIKEVFYDAIIPGDRDFAVTLSKIRAADPDIIVFTGYYPEAAMILRQKREQGWAIPMIGGDATNNASLVEIAGKEAADGYYFVSPPGPGDLKSPEAIKLFEIYRQRHRQLPSSVWSVLAGDAFNVITEAVSKAGSDPARIADYLHKTLKDYPGLTGPISFNEKGDRIGEVYRLYRADSEGAFVLQN
ncbi:MAG: branched-chain amino acid ABC transporter substrate-binding protein [Deltaproteobacteria bacterium]|jgi:branched-chain amino acid transport system substrate-binding protein|nr:branched-chain amino acid ABC transporter substrate-binding protein [Deltaproteobacteria bacterium]